MAADRADRATVDRASRPMHLDITIPATIPGMFGVMDDVWRLFGITNPCDEVFGPLLRDKKRRVGNDDVYPIALPHGEGAEIKLPGPMGSLGFANDNGDLMLTIPRVLVGQIEPQITGHVVEHRSAGPGAVEYRLRLPKGARKGMTTPLGELAVQVQS